MLYYWFFSTQNASTEDITLRAGIAALIAFIMSIVFGAELIKRLRRRGVAEDVTKKDSEELKKLHKSKAGVPTMGGITIIAAVLFAVLICADLSNGYILLVLLTTVWLGVLGFVDDYIKLTRKHAHGLQDTSKFICQLILGLVLGLILYLYFPGVNHSANIIIPILKDNSIFLGLFFVLFVAIFVVGMSNSVNLTDGLDGLAIGCTIIVTLALVILCYISGRVDFSSYLQMPYVPGSGELCVFCASLVGASMGFIWYNGFPAQMFMGDTGSLAIGGMIAIVAVVIKQEILLLFMGGVFVMEALSVIIQVLVFKITKKRVFRCAPIHHHFQFKGWPETRIVLRMWIVTALLSVSGLISMKF